MGGERASSVRQRYAGKVCCDCKVALPLPHRRGEHLCDRCGGGGKKHVYMHFIFFRNGWFCQFLEEDWKTLLPRTIRFTNDNKIWETAQRGGFTLNIAGRREVEDAIRNKQGAIWLELRPDQYARLLRNRKD